MSPEYKAVEKSYRYFQELPILKPEDTSEVKESMPKKEQPTYLTSEDKGDDNGD